MLPTRVRHTPQADKSPLSRSLSLEAWTRRCLQLTGGEDPRPRSTGVPSIDNPTNRKLIYMRCPIEAVSADSSR